MLNEIKLYIIKINSNFIYLKKAFLNKNSFILLDILLYLQNKFLQFGVKDLSFEIQSLTTKNQNSFILPYVYDNNKIIINILCLIF